MVKYIGSKRALLPWIVETIEIIRTVETVNTVVDLFSGSARVGHALKAKGFEVTANDINSYAFVLARALIEADARKYDQPYKKEGVWGSYKTQVFKPGIHGLPH